MGNLGDALHKAGLMSERDLANAKSGRGARNRNELMRRHESKAAASEGDAARARTLVGERGSPAGSKGRVRWHYVARDGTIPFIVADDKLAARLGSGQAAIATDGARVLIISNETAMEADKLDPSTILFWVEAP